MKLTDIVEWEHKNAVLDKEGNVLCPSCQKELAKVTSYGNIRRCKKCQKKPFESSFMFAVNYVDLREADGRELTKDLSDPDPVKRRLASEALTKIRNESKKVKDMRKDLVKAHREGNKLKVKDIHEDIKDKKDYK